MIFKSREPQPEDTASEPTPPAETNASQETTQADPQTTSEPEGDALVGAFEAVAQVVSREIDSVKRNIAELEILMTRRFESERASTTSAINDLRQDVIARIEALRKSHQKDISELGDQSKASVIGLRGQFEPALEKANRRAEEVKAALEQILTSTERKLEQELQALTYSLSGVRTDLDRQVTTSAQVSTLLNNMAELFSDPESLPDHASGQAAAAVREGER